MKTKIIAVLIGLVVLAGVGSAALVGYLSNTMQADVTVSSPMVESFSEDGSTWTQTPITADIYGGETYRFYAKTENLANVAITGNVSNLVTNPDGLNCSDIALLEARTDSGSGYGAWTDITSTCVVIDANTVEYFYASTPMTWAAGQVDITDVNATFKSNALGEYTYECQIVV